MSTKPAPAQAGGKPLSHACGADPAAPSQAETCGNYHDSAKSEQQSVPAGTAGDGADTGMSRMVAHDKQPPRRVSFMLPPPVDKAGDQQHKEQGQWVAARPSSSRPSDVPPPPHRRSEQPPLNFSFAGPGGLPLPPPGSTCVRPDDGAAPPPPRRTVLRLSSASTSDESVSTLERTRARRRLFLSLEHREAPASLWFTACCILFWLLALAIGFALLVVYLRYHHLQPPRMRVTTATLLMKKKNSSSDDDSLGGQEANYSLTIQADIYNPNTELLHMVLRYVPLDLYFNGSLIGTGAVWPALPIDKAPGDSCTTVQLLGSVSVTKEKDDVALWHKATNQNHNDGGVPLELRLVGTFHAQLNIGRWIPSSFSFWVYSRCTLWLDPPPGGALRRSRCSPEYLTK